MNVAGTLGGAATAVVMVGLFAHDRGLFILGMAVLTGLVVYRMQGRRYAFAWLIFSVTSALVGWLAVQNTGATFCLAVMRASTICAGVVVLFSVYAILWPIKAGITFERQLHAFVENCHDLLPFTIRAVAGEKSNAAASMTPAPSRSS